jgi:hypothetical protein
MRNGGSPPAHLSSSTAFALKKDFYHHREEAELVNKFDNEGLCLMTEERRRNKAARAKAFDDKWLCIKNEVWLRLKNEARIAFDDEERRHKRHLRALIERLRQHEAARVMGVDDERLCLMAEERCCHDAATQMAMSVARSCADVYQQGSCTSCRVGSMPARQGSAAT